MRPNQLPMWIKRLQLICREHDFAQGRPGFQPMGAGDPGIPSPVRQSTGADFRDPSKAMTCACSFTLDDKE